MFRKRRKPATFSQVLEALIVLLDKKKLISKGEVQNQILENAGEIKRINVGGIEYKVDREDLDE